MAKQRITQYKRFVPYGTHLNFCFAKTSFMLGTLSEMANPIMEAKMVSLNKEKLTIGKVLLAIIGGFITIEVFRYAISIALQSRYGIDTDVYYMGKVQFSFIIILTIVISSFVGGFL